MHSLLNEYLPCESGSHVLWDSIYLKIGLYIWLLQNIFVLPLLFVHFIYLAIGVYLMLVSCFGYVPSVSNFMWLLILMLPLSAFESVILYVYLLISCFVSFFCPWAPPHFKSSIEFSHGNSSRVIYYKNRIKGECLLNNVPVYLLCYLFLTAASFDCSLIVYCIVHCCLFVVSKVAAVLQSLWLAGFYFFSCTQLAPCNQRPSIEVNFNIYEIATECNKNICIWTVVILKWKKQDKLSLSIFPLSHHSKYFAQPA